MVFRFQGLRLVVIFAAVTGFSAGCTRDVPSLSQIIADQTIDLTSSENDLRERTATFNRTVWQGVATGAVAGAVVGGTVGYVVGGDAKSIAAGAGAGAFLGGLAGNVAGKYVARKQEAFAEKESQLASMIADVEQKNREAAEMINTMRDVVEDSKQRLMQVKVNQKIAAIIENQSQLETVRRNRVLIQEVSESAEEQLGVFQKSVAIYREANPDLDLSQYEREIKNFEERTKTMRDIALSLTDPLIG